MLTSVEIIKKAVISSQLSYNLTLISGNQIHIIPFSFENETDKRAKLIRARRLARDVIKADECWLINEAWMATVEVNRFKPTTIDEERAKLPDNLADYDGRIEVLICQHEIKGGESKVHFFSIVRDADGKIIELPDYHKPNNPRADFVQRNIWILNKPEKLEA